MPSVVSTPWPPASRTIRRVSSPAGQEGRGGGSGARVVFWIFALLALGVGFISAARWRWICDDAFITFRYLDHLLAGQGLVYNIGERVEGYSHFLWLLLLAGLRAAGLELVSASQALGLAADAATLALWIWFSLRLGRSTALLPLTALCLAANYDQRLWATGGLETSAFTLLISVLYLTLVFGSRSRRAYAAVGLLLALIFLLRPDGALFYPLTVAILLWRDRFESRRGLLALHAPLALILAPYLLWKIVYFGQLLPNTAFAKEAGGSNLGQGLHYLGLYLRAYPSTLLAPISIVLLLSWRRASSGLRPALIASSFFAVYLALFVVRVGGDFMFARFIVPIVPLVYATIEISARQFLGPRPIALLCALLALPGAVWAERALRDSIYFDAAGAPRATFGPSGVTDEHWYWSHLDRGKNLIERYEEIGGGLAELFEGTDVRVVIGGQASLAYYARFATAIESNGLTDAYIARLPVARRGRPGHEKVAPIDYLRARGVHFEFMKRPRSHEPYRRAAFQAGAADEWIPAYVVTYDRDLMRDLATRSPHSVQLVDFEAYLDDWFTRAPGRPLVELRRESQDFQVFYFERNDDPVRLAKLEALLR